MSAAPPAPRRATLYRMVTPDHLCPYGLKAKDLLRREGFAVEDRWLTTREQTDAFKAEHGVKSTPQTFINGERVGGYDDLRRRFGRAVADPKATTYGPVVALFAVTALMALAVSYAVYGTPIMILHMELTSGDAIAAHLPEGYVSVGTAVDIRHLAATPVGRVVRVTAQVTKVERKTIWFAVEAWDGARKIGDDRHARGLVNAAEFEARFGVT